MVHYVGDDARGSNVGYIMEAWDKGKVPRPQETARDVIFGSDAHK